MSTTFKQPGDTMEFTAPAGGVTAGIPVLIGGMPVIPVATTAAAGRFRGVAVGVHTLPKTINEGALTEGMPAFWDAANSKISILPDIGHLPIGTIAAAALTGDTTCDVRLNGASLSGRVFNVRKRFTVAQVNAVGGTALVPAIPGARYRMCACNAISVGGAAGAVTTVDVLGTLAAAGRKLVAYAQASLTQSSVLKDGGSGAAVLADGASYTANDAGTAITISKTGADVTTATHIDVQLTYAVE